MHIDKVSSPAIFSQIIVNVLEVPRLNIRKFALFQLLNNWSTYKRYYWHAFVRRPRRSSNFRANSQSVTDLSFQGNILGSSLLLELSLDGCTQKWEFLQGDKICKTLEL